MPPCSTQDLKTQLAAYLERLQQPIELVASLDDSEAARELEELLDEITALSPKISRERPAMTRASPRS
jgi:alkyl hydroperoxide reductase subunit F